MKAVCFIFLFLFCSLSSYAQVIGFEEKVPETFKVSGKGEVKLSSLFYKEGESSLEWDFQPASTLDVQIEPLSLNAKKEQQFGITLWIYNEKPQQDSIRFEFLNKAGEVSYWFTYHLQAAGWRACWISFAYMNGDKKDKNIVSSSASVLCLTGHKEDLLARKAALELARMLGHTVTVTVGLHIDNASAEAIAMLEANFQELLRQICLWAAA